ncbi:hypothetical protein FHS19_004299 [Paenibacillus rhizosphaerae]|uniref:Uncharacterized protein n=1 Tax=Paenibacillus rhizosphaerae TaxID=297318 RepID=A0A839TRF5_9BACL|nr:hypothetical protein [Paenibacillus rhizosphaerae]
MALEFILADMIKNRLGLVYKRRIPQTTYTENFISVERLPACVIGISISLPGDSLYGKL